MQRWYQLFPKNTFASIYLWIIFCIMPFFYIFKSYSHLETAFGLLLVLVFFISYRLSYGKAGVTLYVWTGIQIAISLALILLFGFIYFSLFLAFFIGNIRNKVGFITMYIILLATTTASLSIGFFTNYDLLVQQFPFVIVGIIGVILLPFNSYNRNKRQNLQDELATANEKIAELLVNEERQRIARDLHDTLGQKLSLIRLKSDLSLRLLDKDMEKAKIEMHDVHDTARIALNEIRELVSNMRAGNLAEERHRVAQILQAAEITFSYHGPQKLSRAPKLNENVLALCLKEAVTNVVRHSGASKCTVTIVETEDEVIMTVQDDGPSRGILFTEGNGLRGMRERLEFVNGRLTFMNQEGTTLLIQIPHIRALKE